MLLFLNIVANYPTNVFTINYMKRTAVVPVHHDGADIVHAQDGTASADRRSLHIVHFDKFHMSTYRVLGADTLHQFS